MIFKPLLAAALLAVSLPVLAEFSDNPAENSGKVDTVAFAKRAGEHHVVVLEGYITGRAGTLNPEEYFFKDQTDTVKVEINRDVWRNQKVTPDVLVRITGEVDHNPLNRTVEIEVRHLQVLGKPKH